MIIDTDINCSPHLDDLKKRGVTAIGRYYAARGSKRLTRTEAQAISDAGFKLWIVYEDSGDPELSVDRGRHDAQLALSQARAISQPDGSAIYFAMEHLPSGYGPSDIPGIKLYFEGIRRTFGDAYKVGCYSNGSTLEALLDAKLIQYAWVSASTSFAGTHEFLKTDRWVLAQRKVDLRWDDHHGEPVSADTNDVQGSEFGAFSLPAAVAAGASGAAAGLMSAGEAADALPAPADNPVPVRTALEKGETDRDQEPETPGASRWDISHINELVDQGSRLAASLRKGWTAFKVVVFGGATVAGSAATLVDPTKGNGAVVGNWGSQHPFLMLAIGAGVVAVILGGIILIFGKQAIRGVVSAKIDGRYFPRGTSPAPAAGGSA